MGRKRPRGRVRRAGKRAKADSAHDVYVVGCVLEELTREVEALDGLLPPLRRVKSLFMSQMIAIA